MAWTDTIIWTNQPPSPPPGGTTPLPVVTVPGADAYFLTTPRNSEWVALTDQQVWLSEAQKYLGQLCFDQGADCCGRVFADEWTAAVSELALALSKDPAAVIGGSSSGQVIKSASLGGLSVTYADAQAVKIKYGPNAPKVLQAFPWLGDFLGCWLNVATGSSRIISRCC